MTETVVITRADGVLEIRLNRPEKKNALTSDMYDAMADAFLLVDADPTLRVALLTGTGDTFTSGNDIAAFQARAAAGGEQRAGSRLLPAISAMKKPVIAAVNGAAIGIGTTMLLHCDLVFVADTAKLSAPFVNLALVPEAASSLLLTARIGHARAFALFAMGESLSGAEAPKVFMPTT